MPSNYQFFYASQDEISDVKDHHEKMILDLKVKTHQNEYCDPMGYFE